MTDWNKWLKKRELCADNILYVYRRDRKTIIHREDGEEFELFAPVYTLLALFPEDAFLNINKGIAVNKARIVDISSEGVYTGTQTQPQRPPPAAQANGHQCSAGRTAASSTHELSGKMHPA